MTDSTRAAANRKERDERKSAYLRGIMDRYTQRFRAAAGQDALALAREVHAAADLVLERDRNRSAAGGEIQCRKGCAHCCHGPVEIWPQEALLLVEAARVAGLEIDKARLVRQSAHSVETWRGQPAADRVCVFLGDDGACRVYESRPNACRKLLVTSAPALCDAEKHPPESIERWFSWEAEMMETAAQEILGAGMMARLVLAELDRNR